MVFEWVRILTREALHLGVWHAFGIFRSHYDQIDLEALSSGYVEAPDEEHEAIDDEVLASAATLASPCPLTCKGSVGSSAHEKLM